MSARLISRPISGEEVPYLVRAGAHLRAVREACGVPRSALAAATGLNAKTIYRIQVGARRTRARTLKVIAAALTDAPDEFAAELIALAGPALAPESAYVQRVETRRLRQLRRIQVLEARKTYAAERAAIETRWAERRASRARMRAAFSLIDFSIRQLRRLGVL
jgi:transcriptional regulator with XRE-family HTH domain